MASRPQHIAILGATGSIGRNSLEVIRSLPDRFRVTYLTANTNIDLLREQIAEFHPLGVAVLNERQADKLRSMVGGSVEVLAGEQGVMEVVRRDDVDIVISSLVGFAGVRPTAEAIRHRKHIALANKETLVAAGSYITGLVAEYGVRLIPVDSEHSAILQCLAGEQQNQVTRLILTASGGPFLHTPADTFSNITVDDALRHPNWKMGSKVTIDSATLMNKGLEVIEAHWLFRLPPEKIDVVIHPQSIIHSMVEFVDGSIKAQLGLPDMKLPIQYALTFPERVFLNGGRLSFPKLERMTFFEPDLVRFPALPIAYEALASGGTAPAVLNAANEIAVGAFLDKQIGFTAIAGIIRRSLDRHTIHASPEFEHILEADAWARTTAMSMV
ncbi:MAG: 1-deoxy-D-xylulose-5-phosphate reductoisomerase [Ignavibacteria bacterium RIFCSPHIGHO2_02_FULL_56_12]|nr:MAG: 1-deoxy-D-xylulose-5-phosphate reductoisomerase [Ignavibacteria bacterium RIFCSPHIGHO2_02_FULL_56_12]